VHDSSQIRYRLHPCGWHTASVKLALAPYRVLELVQQARDQVPWPDPDQNLYSWVIPQRADLASTNVEPQPHTGAVLACHPV